MTDIPLHAPLAPVIFRSGDCAIAGKFYLPDPARFTPPFPAVVVCHGIGSRKENQAGFDSHLAERGWAVLGFDFRGHGESEGALDEHTLGDVMAALDWVAAQPSVHPEQLALRGSSMGGMFALAAAARDERVRAVAAIAPAIAAFLAQGVESGFLLKLLERESMAARVDVPAFIRCIRSLDTRADVVRLAPRALMLIQCLGDELVPFTWTQELFALAREPKKLLMIPEGHHRLAQQDPLVHQATGDWFQSYV